MWRQKVSGRLVRVVAATALLCAAAAARGQVPAQAAPGDPGMVQATDLRTCPDLRCSALTAVPAGTRVPTSCWRDAGGAYGSNRWFRVTHGGRTGWVSAARMNPQPSVPYCHDLRAPETLFAGQTVFSPNGRNRLAMQGDGNLVLYGAGGAVWGSATAGTGADRVAMQNDGNLVIYAGSRPAWSSGTMFPGARLVTQDNTDVVVWSGDRPLWATGWHTTRGATRPQNTGVPGYCAQEAYERFRRFSGNYPALTGDAHRWDDSAKQTGWLVRTEPSTQAIVVFEGSISATALGHVAWADGIRPAGGGTEVHIVEMNGPRIDGRGGFGEVSDRWVPHRTGMSYILAPMP